MSALKDYTTKKTPEQTIAEIQNELIVLRLYLIPIREFDEAGNLKKL